MRWFGKPKKPTSLAEEFIDIVASMDLLPDDVSRFAGGNKVQLIDGPLAGHTELVTGRLPNRIVGTDELPGVYVPVLDSLGLPRRGDDGAVFFHYVGV